MKIGYVRLGFPIELEVETGSISTLGTELREGIMRDWLTLEYEVHLVGEVKKSQRELILNNSDKWYNNLKLAEQEFPELDLLFIECGTTNKMYKGKFGSYVERVLQLVNHYNCKIVYYQHGHLPFYDLKKTGKPITILHHFQNREVFKKEFKGYNFGVNIIEDYIPLGYSETDICIKSNEQPHNDLVWIGGQRDSNKNGGSKKNCRKSLIKEFFGHNLYNGTVIGRWDEETVKELSNVKFAGALGRHGDAYKYFNESLCTFWGGSESVRKNGLIPSRPVMALLSGSIVIADKFMYGVEKLIPKEYQVNNKEEALAIINKVKLLSAEERNVICKNILKTNFKTWKELFGQYFAR